MPAAADLLAALDPEQRQVAEALRGPVRVLAGAGTGKTRAITHRIAHGVATGVYAPDRGARGHLHDPGGRRDARPAARARRRAASRPAPSTPRRCASSATSGRTSTAPSCRTLIESKLGLLATAARRQRLNADQALLRDLASEIEWAKVSNVHPDDYADVAAARGRSVAGQDPDGRRPRLRRLRGGQARPGPDGHGGRPAADRRACSPRTSGSPPRSAGSTSGSSSTSSRTSRRSSRRCSTCGSAAATSSAWSATRPRRSTPSPAPTPTTCATSRAKFPGTTSIELVRNYRSTPRGRRRRQHAARRHRQPAASTCAPSGRPAPRSRYDAHPDEVAEAEAVAARIAPARATAAATLGEIAVLFRINAQSEAFEEALAARGIPYVVRGAARFFDRPEVREAVTRLRGAARSGEAGDGRDVLETRARASSAGMGWTAEAPTAPRPDPRPLGVLAGAGRPGAGVRRAPTARRSATFVDDLDRRAAEQHAPVADGVTLATFHAAKGLEWDSVFLCGLQDGTLPITYAETPGRRSRRSAGCSTSA